MKGSDKLGKFSIKKICFLNSFWNFFTEYFLPTKQSKGADGGSMGRSPTTKRKYSNRGGEYTDQLPIKGDVHRVSGTHGKTNLRVCLIGDKCLHEWKEWETESVLIDLRVGIILTSKLANKSTSWGLRDVSHCRPCIGSLDV